MLNGYVSPEELDRLSRGEWHSSYEKLGAHLACLNGESGCMFAVWAPGVKSVSVAGSFNGWKYSSHAMLPAQKGGVWHLFVPGVRQGDLYKYVIETYAGEIFYKADPCASYAQIPPETASVVWDPSYSWHDARWLAKRNKQNPFASPMNIYEVHPGSWKRNCDGSVYSYDQLREELLPYVCEMGFTHIELMPVMEHPFDGSWGYQTTGYFAPCSRYGTPQEFKRFVDACHEKNVGVILDWVPGHFCRDAHGLGRFNGAKLYEKYDHEQWGTYKFDFGRPEVKNFLISSALFWLKEYHADGLRVDGVTSMLYLNFGVSDESKKVYNSAGGEEDTNAVEFLRTLNRTVGRECPGALMIAEESTAWPLVTYPPEDGGLGFHFKWDMGWMNDTLRYIQTDFPYRPYGHDKLTFSIMYAFNENFVLPLSHDEVVHGKCSLIRRMPGDYWRQFAGLRSLALYQICHPGAKLNFMGNEIAQFIEWRYYEGIEWFLLDYESHRLHRDFVKALNAFYKKERALWARGCTHAGFEWIDPDNASQSVISFIRRGDRPGEELVVVINFTPATYESFRIGVPAAGNYRELFNSDRPEYGGSGQLNTETLKTENIPFHNREQSLVLRIPPLGGTVLKRVK